MSVNEDAKPEDYIPADDGYEFDCGCSMVITGKMVDETRYAEHTKEEIERLHLLQMEKERDRWKEEFCKVVLARNQLIKELEELKKGMQK